MATSVQSTKGHNDSYNLASQNERSNRMMRNYDRWMNLWGKDFKHAEKARSRMNEWGYTKNWQYNAEHVEHDTVTIIDKTESKLNDPGDKLQSDLQGVMYKPAYD